MAAETRMDQARFDAIVAAYGADPRRWPDEERDAALAFAQASGADLREARALDALLDLASAPAAPSDLLQARILRAIPKRGVPMARVAAALAACAVFGLAIGYGAGVNAPASDVEQALATAFESPADAWLGEES
jgi:hypothetical protein